MMTRQTSHKKRPIKRWAKQQERVHTLTVHSRLRASLVRGSFMLDYLFLISRTLKSATDLLDFRLMRELTLSY